MILAGTTQNFAINVVSSLDVVAEHSMKWRFAKLARFRCFLPVSVLSGWRR